jgi:hypothetical protein
MIPQLTDHGKNSVRNFHILREVYADTSHHNSRDWFSVLDRDQRVSRTPKDATHPDRRSVHVVNVEYLSPIAALDDDLRQIVVAFDAGSGARKSVEFVVFDGRDQLASRIKQIGVDGKAVATSLNCENLATADHQQGNLSGYGKLNCAGPDQDFPTIGCRHLGAAIFWFGVCSRLERANNFRFRDWVLWHQEIGRESHNGCTEKHPRHCPNGKPLIDYQKAAQRQDGNHQGEKSMTFPKLVYVARYKDCIKNELRDAMRDVWAMGFLLWLSGLLMGVLLSGFGRTSWLLKWQFQLHPFRLAGVVGL